MTIDEEFQKLIPPLTDDEYRQLEENCIKEGIRDSLVVWTTPSGTQFLVDGHNRYKIAQSHNLEYKVKEMEFSNRDEAKVWIAKNQMGRRNLLPQVRAKLALKVKPEITRMAKERQNLGLKSDEGRRTDEELGKIAGVGKDTIRKIEKIEAEATPHIKELLYSGTITTNQAYNSTFPKVLDPEKKAKQEHEEYIEKVKSGEVVSIHEAQRDKTNREILYDSFMVALYKPLTAVNGFGLMYQTKTIEQMGAKMPQELKENILFKLEHCIRILESVKKTIERSGE